MIDTIDINCDMGEGMQTDSLILPFISSANIACGYHAGDADTMKRTVENCLNHQVAIGAHPSFNDRENFGRIDLTGTRLQPEDIPAMVASQLYELQKICIEMGTRMHHVKLHGALYNRAARDLEVANLVCEVVSTFDASLVFYGLSGSKMKQGSGNYNLRFASEVFADRTYGDDGSLTPRSMPGALIDNEEQCMIQLTYMIHEKVVISGSGKRITVKPDTICIHSDGEHALSFARAIHQYLKSSNVAVKTIS